MNKLTNTLPNFVIDPKAEALLQSVHLTRKARHEPNTFIETCFTDTHGRRLTQAHLHRDLQAFLTQHPKAIVELPRDHGKSTQVCMRVLWELGRDAGLRIKIICASEALAAERSRFIREAIEQNLWVRLVFPHLLPDHPWGDVRFSVVRPGRVIGPSVMAVGIGGASTGSRADLLICDDIVDVRSVSSRAERDRVKQLFRDNLMNLLEPEGRFWGLCTPWHRDDLNAELKRNTAYGLFHRSIDEHDTPIWPERWPTAALKQRQAEIGAVSYARGYRLLPLAEQELFIRPEMIHFWQVTEPADRLIIAIDPAVATHAQADATGIVILAQVKHEVHCRHATRQRINVPTLMEQLAQMTHDWQPDAIIFEANAAFRGIADVMVRHTSFGNRLQTVTHHRDKASRIAAFSVPVQNGLFKLHGESGQVPPSQQALFDEMTTFPVAEHDDLLDAAAFGTEWLMKSQAPRVF